MQRKVGSAKLRCLSLLRDLLRSTNMPQVSAGQMLCIVSRCIRIVTNGSFTWQMRANAVPHCRAPQASCPQGILRAEGPINDNDVTPCPHLLGMYSTSMPGASMVSRGHVCWRQYRPSSHSSTQQSLRPCCFISVDHAGGHRHLHCGRHLTQIHHAGYRHRCHRQLMLHLRRALPLLALLVLPWVGP
jgi:hypothetical protein